MKEAIREGLKLWGEKMRVINYNDFSCNILGQCLSQKEVSRTEINKIKRDYFKFAQKTGRVSPFVKQNSAWLTPTPDYPPVEFYTHLDLYERAKFERTVKQEIEQRQILVNGFLQECGVK